jgi:hypothetical protein
MDLHKTAKGRSPTKDRIWMILVGPVVADIVLILVNTRMYRLVLV